LSIWSNTMARELDIMGLTEGQATFNLTLNHPPSCFP
jgi:hypothetical protein